MKLPGMSSSHGRSACMVLLAGVWVSANVAAQSEAPTPPPIREPLPPKVLDPEQQLDPEVVIRREPGRTIEEYSSGGRVYMVRIIPAAGPAYYLIDTTGDGLLDQRNEHMQPVRPAHWRIFEW